MSHPNTDLMYVNIPKNASSWVKFYLTNDWSWEYYNYHQDNLYHKHALVILRDPIDRWISGIAEYMYVYHRNINPKQLPKCFIELVFEQIAFDDHTEKQILFLEQLNLNNCTFFWCDSNFRSLFGKYFLSQGMQNNYSTYHYIHESESDPYRKKVKEVFKQLIETNSKYRTKLEDFFRKDYTLIKALNFYAG